MSEAAAQIEFSVRKYRRSYRRYERRHPEIFNPVEQGRLEEELARAAAEIGTSSTPPEAIDLGCGTGNLTDHLLRLGLNVTALDVSPEFLDLVERRFREFSERLRTLRINGEDLGELEDRSVDFVGAYSVLHHIPDYLGMVTEACRVLRPGGIVYLDHEANDNFYDKQSCFWDLMREVEHRRLGSRWWNPNRRRWQRFLMPSKYYTRLRQVFDPAYPWNVEGDIHVWKGDRIEWNRVEERLAEGGCEVVRRCDYLNYSSDYPDDIWRHYADRCTNMRLVVARRAGR